MSISSLTNEDFARLAQIFKAHFSLLLTHTTLHPAQTSRSNTLLPTQQQIVIFSQSSRHTIQSFQTGKANIIPDLTQFKHDLYMFMNAKYLEFKAQPADLMDDLGISVHEAHKSTEDSEAWLKKGFLGAYHNKTDGSIRGPKLYTNPTTLSLTSTPMPKPMNRSAAISGLHPAKTMQSRAPIRLRCHLTHYAPISSAQPQLVIDIYRMCPDLTLKVIYEAISLVTLQRHRVIGHLLGHPYHWHWRACWTSGKATEQDR